MLNQMMASPQRLQLGVVGPFTASTRAHGQQREAMTVQEAVFGMMQYINTNVPSP